MAGILWLLSCLAALAGCADSRAPAASCSTSDAAFALPALVVNDSLGVEDRCTTCHCGVLDPGRKLEPQPLTAHPGRLLEIHSPRRFGCTPCHEGDGSATTARAAHGGVAGGLGIRTGMAVEISCGKCHLGQAGLDGAPHLSRGRVLMRRAQCLGCHEVGGAGPSGPPGPDLAGIASRTNAVWLFRWLKNPRDYAPDARMPRFPLEDRYVDALVGYLLTFRAAAGFDTSRFPPGDAERGERLFRLSFCISCHAVDGKGGRDAIDLGRVGNKLGRARLLQIVTDTHGAYPRSPMPQYRFTDAQAADLAEHLTADLADPWFDSPETDSALARVGSFWPTPARRAEVGRRLFKELRCGNCHAYPGGEKWIRVGPLLSRLGEKRVAEISWGATRFPRTLEDFVWRKVENPHAFATAPYRFKMPTYDLPPDDARDVAIAVLAQADLPLLPDRFLVRDRSRDTLHLAGEFRRLFERYRCLSCHSVNGIGNNISYDLGVEGSRVRKKWLHRYLKRPYTIRPILTVRMPIFNLTDEEARVLADGIAAMMRDSSIDSAGAFAIGPRGVEVGRRLFVTSGCLSCHQVGRKGGYVGPSFTGGAPVGSKLQPGWIVRWLEDSHALKPDVLEPRYRFTRDQAQALTAYLLTLSPGASETMP